MKGLPLMLPLPLPNLQVLHPSRNPALGAILVKPDIGQTVSDPWMYRALLADRVAWMMDHADSLRPLTEAFDHLGIGPTTDRIEMLDVIRSPEFGEILASLGVEPPVRRPRSQAAALARIQEIPLEEWAAMLQAAT